MALHCALNGLASPAGRLHVQAENNALNAAGKCQTHRAASFSRVDRVVRASVSAQFTPAQWQHRKDALLELCKKAPGNGIYASPELRAAIEQSAIDFVCDTSSPSPLRPATEAANAGVLDGFWDLQFTNTMGTSAGKLGPFVGKVTQEVDVRKTHKYWNYLDFGPFIRLALRADWSVVDDERWKVIFEFITVNIAGKQLFKKDFGPDAGGLWWMGYADKDMRILWATGNRLPPVTENAERDAQGHVIKDSVALANLVKGSSLFIMTRRNEPL
eukprot:jgi/Mesvir1/16670/Mv15072-RA.1